MRDSTVTVSTRMAALIEIQTDVVPFLRDNHYPRVKLAELETMLEEAFAAGEIKKGNNVRKMKSIAKARREQQ